MVGFLRFRTPVASGRLALSTSYRLDRTIGSTPRAGINWVLSINQGQLSTNHSRQGSRIYRPFLVRGTNPITMPPPRALAEWVSYKFGVVGVQAMRLGFAIARSIARKGTIANSYPRQALVDARPRIAFAAQRLRTRLKVLLPDFIARSPS